MDEKRAPTELQKLLEQIAPAKSAPVRLPAPDASYFAELRGKHPVDRCDLFRTPTGKCTCPTDDTQPCGQDRRHGAHPWYIRRTQPARSGVPHFVDQQYWCPGLFTFGGIDDVEKFLEDR